MKRTLLTTAICSTWLVAPVAAQATLEPVKFQLSEGVHGGTGLIQTPTARMREAGSMRLNYSDNQEYRFWTVSLQLFPWMESTVRYSDIRYRLYSPFPGFSGDQTLKDKAIDVKFRLLQEDYWLPEVSVGFRDFGGTGFFESEFLAASKRFGPFDLHLGLGWGYLGRQDDVTNPFCQLRDSFCQRAGGFGGRGGKIDYQNFFKGPMAVFGGIEYQTPWQPLRLQLEFEGNDYSRDRAGRPIVPDSRWNAGISYRWNNFDLNLNYQRGNTVGFAVNYEFNLHQLDQIKLDRPPLNLLSAEPVTEPVNQQRLRALLRQQAGFLVTHLRVDEEEVVVAGSQIKYRDFDESVERIGRVLATELPEHVTSYRIIETSGAFEVAEARVDANAFKVAARYETLQPDISSSYVRTSSLARPDTDWHYKAQGSGVGYGLEAFWLQMFGSPEAFYMYQGGVMPSVSWQANRNFSVSAIGKLTLLENFDKFNFKVDSEDTPLPRVRTYVREYVTRSRFTMEALFANWQQQLHPDVFVMGYGGYLESMFAGIGTELLYRPMDSQLAVGFDLNYVRQRSFENDFSLMDYSVLTGHVNLYWEPRFLDATRITLNIGRYLAKDKGVTIDFAKRFDSGIVVGAFAALTNVSAADYGEGSFTKGFYLSIPFDLMSLSPSRGSGYLPWIPIARDGGQPLNRPIKLIDVTERRSRFGG